ncbi:PAS domain S-box protein [Nitrospira sp. Kam-Ns4a]
MSRPLSSRLHARLRLLAARSALRLAGPLACRTEPDRGTPTDATFRTLLDVTEEGLCGLDREGCCTFINQAGAALLGYAPEELLGRRFHPVHHHSRADGAPYPEEACPISQTLRTGQSCRVEDEVFWRRDGSCFPVAYAAHPILEGETLAGAIVTYTDITGRQWTVSALLESETRFRSAFDHAAVGMALIEPSGRLLQANHAFGAMLGYPPQTLQGMTWQEITHPEDLEGNLREFRRLLAGEVPVLQLEKRYRHRDGRVVWALVNATPVRDERGAVLYCVSHVLDLTDRKRALEALEESERRFAAFMNNTTVVAWMKDVRFRYVYINEPYERLIGIPREQIAGRTDFEVFPDATARQLRRNDEEVLRTDRPLETHEIAPDRKGQLRTWWVYKFPFRDAASRVFVGGIAFDITERDRIEQALRDRGQDLLRLLDERERLVQDLHDGIIQEIYAIGLGLVETRRLTREDPAQAERRLDDAVADLNQVIHELRATSPIRRRSP